MQLTKRQQELAAQLGTVLLARGLRIATAESCTGGLIAGAITAIAGSSDWFERGFVTYSNAAKEEMLGVAHALIAEHGAVSEPVAHVMVEGSVQKSGADCAVSVTGVAGPGGGTAAKPVGMVCFGFKVPGKRATTITRMLPGDRAAVRAASVEIALALIIGLLKDEDFDVTQRKSPP